MELVNEWIPTGNFIEVDTPFCIESTYEKEIVDALTLTENDPCKAETEYHGKFGHTDRLKSMTIKKAYTVI